MAEEKKEPTGEAGAGAEAGKTKTGSGANIVKKARELLYVPEENSVKEKLKPSQSPDIKNNDISAVLAIVAKEAAHIRNVAARIKTLESTGREEDEKIAGALKEMGRAEFVSPFIGNYLDPSTTGKKEIAARRRAIGELPGFGVFASPEPLEKIAKFEPRAGGMFSKPFNLMFYGATGAVLFLSGTAFVALSFMQASGVLATVGIGFAAAETGVTYYVRMLAKKYHPYVADHKLAIKALEQMGDVDAIKSMKRIFNSTDSLELKAEIIGAFNNMLESPKKKPGTEKEILGILLSIVANNKLPLTISQRTLAVIRGKMDKFEAELGLAEVGRINETLVLLANNSKRPTRTEAVEFVLSEMGKGKLGVFRAFGAYGDYRNVRRNIRIEAMKLLAEYCKRNIRAIEDPASPLVTEYRHKFSPVFAKLAHRDAAKNSAEFTYDKRVGGEAIRLMNEIQATSANTAPKKDALHSKITDEAAGRRVGFSNEGGVGLAPTEPPFRYGEPKIKLPEIMAVDDARKEGAEIGDVSRLHWNYGELRSYAKKSGADIGGLVVNIIDELKKLSSTKIEVRGKQDKVDGEKTAQLGLTIVAALEGIWHKEATEALGEIASRAKDNEMGTSVTLAAAETLRTRLQKFETNGNAEHNIAIRESNLFALGGLIQNKNAIEEVKLVAVSTAAENLPDNDLRATSVSILVHGLADSSLAINEKALDGLKAVSYADEVQEAIFGFVKQHGDNSETRVEIRIKGIEILENAELARIENCGSVEELDNKSTAARALDWLDNNIYNSGENRSVKSAANISKSGIQTALDLKREILSPNTGAGNQNRTGANRKLEL
ncbi:Uncharacterised protein [Candidatus Gugararchaeum adminiculabundum]|nr:Uncharacterised protein [Candidatus Gugararchaeum adminiculabundum]